MLDGPLKYLNLFWDCLENPRSAILIARLSPPSLKVTAIGGMGKRGVTLDVAKAFTRAPRLTGTLRSQDAENAHKDEKGHQRRC